MRSLTVDIHGEQSPITNLYRLYKVAPTRADRGRLLAEGGLVHPRGGRYFVESLTGRLRGESGLGYWVTVNPESCQCPDWENSQAAPGFNGCQHTHAVRVYREAMRQSLRRGSA